MRSLEHDVNLEAWFSISVYPINHDEGSGRVLHTRFLLT